MKRFFRRKNQKINCISLLQFGSFPKTSNYVAENIAFFSMRVKIWWESNKKKTERILWSELLAISKQIAYLFALLSIWLTWKPVSRPVILWAAGFHAYSSENLTRISSFRHSKAIHSEILIEGKRENTITMCATALGVKTVEKSHLIELKGEKKPFNQIQCVLYWCNTAGTNQFLRILPYYFPLWTKKGATIRLGQMNCVDGLCAAVQ